MNHLEEPVVSSHGKIPGGRLLLGLFCVLAVLHTTQAIWRSGGAAYPGDPGDARFNNLVLEHDYLALRGIYEWFSPSQFFPTKGTLGYSDTHFGTLPFYAAARFAGLSIERSFQIWFVLIALANALACVRLLRALRVDEFVAGPVLYVACAAPTLVWYTGNHAQIAVLFPTMLLWDQMVRASNDGKLARVPAILGFFAWQFAASPYIAVFASFLCAFALLTWSALAWRISEIRPQLDWRCRGRDWRLAGLVFIWGTSLAWATANAYLAVIRQGHGRNMGELILLAPDWRSWLSIPPGHWVYPQRWPAMNPDAIEGTLFFGFAFLSLGLVSIASAVKGRRTRRGALALAFGTAFVVSIVFFTRWTSSGSGGFLWLAEVVHPLRAFRASGRIAALLPCALAVPVAVFLTNRLMASSNTRRRILVMGMPLLAVIESLMVHQNAVSVADMQSRADAIVGAWKTAGDRPVLLFTPGYSNQGNVLPQLDAWNAAMLLHRHCVNGFSGGWPPAYGSLAMEPTPENGEALLRQLALPAERVTIVRDWPPPTIASQNIVSFPTHPSVALDGFEVQPFWWKAFHSIEPFDLHGVRAYRFLPSSEIRFAIPDSAVAVDFVAGLHPDSFAAPGRSDGVGIGWTVSTEDGTVIAYSRKSLDPADAAVRAGMVPVQCSFPPGHGRILHLVIDAGLNGQSSWDMSYLGQLRLR